MPTSLLRRALVTGALAALFVAATPALASTETFTADLKGSSEVPPTDSKGNGAVDATYDTASKKLSWTISYSGLTGNAAAAHFHGPADPGANAPPVVPITGKLTSPITGSATLTNAQAADLEAGKLYFNIHTAAHKNGEIRGQLVKK
jgi:hypothetical protein